MAEQQDNSLAPLKADKFESPNAHLPWSVVRRGFYTENNLEFTLDQNRLREAHSLATAGLDYYNPQIHLQWLRKVQVQLGDLITKNESINAELNEGRERIIRTLYGKYAGGQYAAGGLTNSDNGEVHRDMCIEFLKSMKKSVTRNQDSLQRVDEAIEGHTSFRKFSMGAIQEVGRAIRLLKVNTTMQLHFVIGGSIYPIGLMTALARLTSGEDYQSIPPAIYKPSPKPLEKADARRGPFECFSKLPVEIRFIIWGLSLPGQRLLTHSSRHNKNLSLLSTCIESRDFVQSRYTRILSPTYKTTATNNEFLWVDLNNDIVVRDLSTPDSNNPYTNVINRPYHEFSKGCYRVFTGLVNVKHLAVAYDVLHRRHSGLRIFHILQACAPALETLMIIPSTQVDGSPLKKVKASVQDNVHLIDIDSNVHDYVCFRKAQIQDNRLLKRKGGTNILSYLNIASPYKAVFQDYVSSVRGSWNPKFRVCLVTRWDEACQGWKMRSLKGDKKYGWKGRCGFVSSEIMCGADGEVLSRYDGIARLFGDD